MNKRIFVYLGIIVAVVVGIGVLRGVIPPKSGIEGTIGAANRYQSPQIADKDVALENSEFNDLLQSDVVHKLATNAEFRKAWNSENFRHMIQEPAVQKAFASQKFADFMAKGGVEDILAQARATKGGSVEGHAVATDPNQKNTTPTLDRKVSADLSKSGGVSGDLSAKGAVSSDVGKRIAGAGELQRRTDLDALMKNNPEIASVLQSKAFLEFAKTNGADVTALFRNQDAVQFLSHAPLLRNPARIDDLSRAINGSPDTEKRAR